MTISEFNIGKELLENIEIAENTIETLTRMKGATKEKTFKADLVSYKNNGIQGGVVTFTSEDKNTFIKIIDILIQEEENLISSLKEQFNKL